MLTRAWVAWLPALGVLALGFAVTAISYRYVRGLTERQREERFDRETLRMAAAMNGYVLS